jgi:hypothetical protein
MNTAPSSNPFSGLKATLARILSGGWMGVVLHLLFRRRIEAALTALEDLFAQWKAGTLAPLAVAVPMPAAGREVAAAGVAPARHRAPRAAGRKASRVRRRPVVGVAVARRRVGDWHWVPLRRSAVPGPCVRSPLRRRGRCTGGRGFGRGKMHAHIVPISK